MINNKIVTGFIVIAVLLLAGGLIALNDTQGRCVESELGGKLCVGQSLFDKLQGLKIISVSDPAGGLAQFITGNTVGIQFEFNYRQVASSSDGYDFASVLLTEMGGNQLLLDKYDFATQLKQYECCNADTTCPLTSGPDQCSAIVFVDVVLPSTPGDYFLDISIQDNSRSIYYETNTITVSGESSSFCGDGTCASPETCDNCRADCLGSAYSCDGTTQFLDARISGVVRDSVTSNTIANADVKFDRWSDVTDSQGRFSIDVLQKTTGFLEVNVYGYDSFVQSISIDSGDIVDLSVSLQKTQTSPTDLCRNKVCNDANPCTTDFCDSGNCFSLPKSCPTNMNCDSETGICKEILVDPIPEDCRTDFDCAIASIPEQKVSCISGECVAISKDAQLCRGYEQLSIANTCFFSIGGLFTGDGFMDYVKDNTFVIVIIIGTLIVLGLIIWLIVIRKK